MEYSNMHNGQQVPIFLPTNQPTMMQQQPSRNSFLQSSQSPFLQSPQAQTQASFMQHPTAQSSVYQMTPSNLQFAMAANNMASMSLPTGPSPFFNLPASTDAAHQSLLQQTGPMYRPMPDHTYAGAMTHGMPQSSETRPRFNKEEVERLEAMYKEEVKPSTEAKKHMAMELGVATAKINNWFQNRRAKAKLEEKAEQTAAEQRRTNGGASTAPSTETAPTEVVNEHFTNGDTPLRPSTAAFPSTSTASPSEAACPPQSEVSSPQSQSQPQSQTQSPIPAPPQVQIKTEAQSPATATTPTLSSPLRTTPVSLAMRRSRHRNGNNAPYTPGSHDISRSQSAPRIRVPSTTVSGRVKKNSVSSASSSSGANMSNGYIPQNMVLSVSVDHHAPRSLSGTPLNSPYAAVAPGASNNGASNFPAAMSPTSSMPRNGSFSLASSATPSISHEFSPILPNTPNSEGRMLGSAPVTPVFGESVNYIVGDYMSSLTVPMAYDGREFMGDMATGAGATAGDVSPTTQTIPVYGTGVGAGTGADASIGNGLGLGMVAEMVNFGAGSESAMFNNTTSMQTPTTAAPNTGDAIPQNVDLSGLEMLMGSNRSQGPFTQMMPEEYFMC
ncbi:hypothetical protein BROUX41_001447 [Berkeleyomyces rouxiae]|uniref:uncharacterized protein n=1 Tax=Berkeleyomyces rouxiae TaxID=2035830 RepID=UPI003B791E0E